MNKDDATEVLKIRIGKVEKAMIDKLAIRGVRTIAGQIRYMLRDWIDQNVEPEEPSYLPPSKSPF